MTIKLPVLYYHKVATPPAGANASIYMEPNRFRQQLRWLKRLGYTSCNCTEFHAAVQKQQAPGKKILITFDDGHLDNYTTALPILKEEGFTATIFVVADYVGKKLRFRSTPEGSEGDPIMSAEQIREWLAAGGDIQSHTLSHPNLADIDPEQAKREITDSRKRLEDIIQREVKFFCYPFGSFRPWQLDVIRDAGYDGAFSTIRGVRHSAEERFHYRRVPVHYSHKMLSFLYDLTFRPFKQSEAQLAKMINPARNQGYVYTGLN